MCMPLPLRHPLGSHSGLVSAESSWLVIWSRRERTQTAKKVSNGTDDVNNEEENRPVRHRLMRRAWGLHSVSTQFVNSEMKQNYHPVALFESTWSSLLLLVIVYLIALRSYFSVLRFIECARVCWAGEAGDDSFVNSTRKLKCVVFRGDCFHRLPAI